MEEYLKKLLEQVRFKEAHKSIEEEIRSHIEDQISDNISSGMDMKEAEETAIADMGDPVEVGISMDRVHRPQIAWNVIAIAGLVGIVSSIVHILIVRDAGNTNNAINIIGSDGFYINVVLGIIGMGMVYLIDYTIIAKYAKIIAFVMFSVLLLGSVDLIFHKANMYLAVGPFCVLASTFMLLYIPLYGAIVYKYRGSGVDGLAKAIIWMIIPMLFAIRWPKLITATVLLLTMTIQLSVAIIRGWFKVPRITTVVTLWAMIAGIPIGVLLFLYKNGLLPTYQANRIRAFLYLDNDAAYVTKTVRSFADVYLMNGSGKSIIGALPNPNSDFLLLYLANRYGLIVSVSIASAVAALIILGCIASAKSKNQLGLIMGVGCMTVLLVQAMLNLLENIGVLPYTDSFMPFFSAGASNIILAYIFLGVILSIYKYKNAYPQYVDTRIRGKIRLGDVEILKN